jgi:hypothetical protein
MTREIIPVDKEALIAAVLELERQNEIETRLMKGYLNHLKRLVSHLEAVVNAERSSHAKTLLYRHFLPDKDWIEILTDELIQAWQAEADNLAKGSNSN